MSNPIHVSFQALEEFKRQLELRKSDTVRFGVRGGTCNGYSYVIQFEDQPVKKHDIVWSENGINFVVDKKSLILLSGSSVVWNNKSLLNRGLISESKRTV